MPLPLKTVSAEAIARIAAERAGLKRAQSLQKYLFDEELILRISEKAMAEMAKARPSTSQMGTSTERSELLLLCLMLRVIV